MEDNGLRKEKEKGKRTIENTLGWIGHINTDFHPFSFTLHPRG